MTPQQKTIMDHFKRRGELTQREALLDYRIARLASRIDELRQMGHDIKSVNKRHQKTGQRYVNYVYQPPEEATK